MTKAKTKSIIVVAVAIALSISLVTGIAISIIFKQSDSESYSVNFSKLEAIPDFNITNEKSYLESLPSGKETILVFWGSWCPHCESLLDAIGENDSITANTFTVAEDENIDDVRDRASDFPIYLDRDQSVYNSFCLEHVPSMFIITDCGKVIGSAEGERECIRLLEEYEKRHS